jgi:hypothetical protein
LPQAVLCLSSPPSLPSRHHPLALAAPACAAYNSTRLHNPPVTLQLGETLADLVRKQTATLGDTAGTQRALKKRSHNLPLVFLCEATSLGGGVV